MKTLLSPENVFKYFLEAFKTLFDKANIKYILIFHNSVHQFCFLNITVGYYVSI